MLPAGGPRALSGFFFLWPAQHPEWALKPTQAQGLCSLPGPERLQLLSQGRQRNDYMHLCCFPFLPPGNMADGLVQWRTQPRRWETWVLVLVLPLTECGTLGTSRKRGRLDHF